MSYYVTSVVVGQPSMVNQSSPLPGSPGGRLAVDHIVERALEEAGIYQQHRVVGNAVSCPVQHDIVATLPWLGVHARAVCGSIP